MNYKLLFPTYRTRLLFVEQALGELRPRASRMLNLGTGEGDLDRFLRPYCDELYACDINADDIEFARRLNRDLDRVHYSVQDALDLSYDDAFFDAVTCLEVIEHVADPERLLSQIARVLRPGGTLVLTCPSLAFPATYDPLNFLLSFGGRHLPLGAYGYGHDWLVDAGRLEQWLADAGLQTRHKRHLTGAIAGSLECYWPGLVQRVLKANAGNREGQQTRGPSLRPSTQAPPLVTATDWLIALDTKLLSHSRRSVGLGYVARNATELDASISEPTPNRTSAGA